MIERQLTLSLSDFAIMERKLLLISKSRDQQVIHALLSALPFVSLSLTPTASLYDNNKLSYFLIIANYF